MKKVNFSEIMDVDSLKKMAQSIYDAAGIPIGIIDSDGEIKVAVGWQDICLNFHRKNPIACKNCFISDQYIKEHLNDGGYISYKCLNNMWDIGLPIIVDGQHIATIFLGQFFYEDEEIDIECFRSQALKFGFDEKEYLNALQNVPRFTKRKVDDIMAYYTCLVETLAKSGLSQMKYKKSQIQYKNSQKYLNTIFNSVSDAIIIHDINGNIIDVNETAIYMFGYSKTELTKMNITNIISKCNTDFSIINLIKKARDKNPLIAEFICKNSKYKEFWVEVNIHIISMDEDEKVVATVRDITERKQSEIAMQNQAMELEKLRTEFFANISHELRTPLNIIFGVIQILEKDFHEGNISLDMKKILDYMSIERQNCFRLLRLINNLIDSTKLDAGYIEVNMVNYNIVNIVEEITLSVVDYANSNNINLIFDTDVEEKVIACDLDKIERIILNLLSNSIKFTSYGGSIRVSTVDGEEYITIIVEDTGMGIPDDKIDVIFDRFRQVDKSFTRSHEGSGIGLSLVKSMVEIQGGKITVESKYGHGTKFIIKLPNRVVEDKESKENTKLIDYTKQSFVERIKVEFSDIYK